MTRSADRIHLDRKALRGPDEFQTLTAQVTGWIGQNRQLATAVAGGVVALAVIALGIGWYSQRRAEAAAIRFQVAHNEFDAGKFTEAAASFASLREDYPRTPFGRLATLYRAHSLARAGDAAGAATAYQEYLASSPPAPYLRQSALVGVGRAQEVLGDQAAALQAFTDAAAIPGPFAIEAMLGQARLQEASGDVAAAQKTYTALADEEGVQLDAELRRLVESKLREKPAADAEAAAPQTGDGGS
jgi:predicted negative regulator of RcsB-dependent stress response